MDPKLVYAARKHLRKENKRYSKVFELVSKEDWPRDQSGWDWIYNDRMRLSLVWRSCEFLVQVLEPIKPARDSNVYRTLGVSRTMIDDDGHWIDGISWDDLMRVKAGVGYADLPAVEAYPAQDDVVNVANIRWLWVLNERPSFFWRG